MDSEMFDVFEESAPAAPRRKVETAGSTRKKRLANGEPKAGNSASSVDGQSAATDVESEPKRRKRTGSHDDSDEEEEDADSDDDDDDDDDNTEVSPPRRLVKDSQAPVAVDADSFETEQSREVAAAQGLQAQKDGQAVILSHQVRHQVSIPPGYDYTPIQQHKPSANPAKSYPFQLDPFQQVAVNSIERNESVLVSAHTSAGKTVVAEYAIAQCLKNNQRVIYTSPIKALSNQKYREFSAEFGDVGLMTGDVTINPTATCLVMTTEILRSMLYRGSEIMREVAWVVFDEVHYLRDASRGVVWEETIILLPDKVRYVFLSATIPNAMQFAEWIVKTHNQPCHVVYTDFRPTPLQHYLFPAGGDGILLVVDEKGIFREENFNKAMQLIAEKKGDDPADPNARRKGKGKDKRLNKGGPKDDTDIYKIIKMIMQKSFNPVIVFSFSKRECENYALQMSSLAFNDESEKQMVSKVFNSALEMLSEEDRSLPQITNILPLLRRGIGIHHSGLLPILKETIEILFQEGLLKVLFATETFSIGLNMPAKTVVFTKVRKFDGTATRWLSPSEFIQMSGRAGRRGLDERGLVIMMVDEAMEPSAGKEIVRGQQDNLKSAFHLGYNMILNLMRVEGISPEFMLEHCFYQFQNTASVSGLERELEKFETERANMKVPEEGVVREYYDLRKQLDKYTKDMKEVITHPSYALPFMQGGRLVKVKYQEFDFGWGVVVDFKERPSGETKDTKPQEHFVVHCLLAVSTSNTSSVGHGSQGWLPAGIMPARAGEDTRMEIVPVLLSCIESIGHVRLFLPKELRTPEQRQTVRKSLNEVKRRFPDGIAVLDPIENMGITDDGFKKLLRKIEVLESRLLASPLHGSERLPELYNQYARKQDMAQKIRETKKRISDALAVMHMDELKCRKRVLRRLGFINEADVVQLKARVACEISTGDELVLSELLFNRFFNEMSPELCAACLSCFIFEERTELKEPLREELTKPFGDIQAQARIVAKISQESKLSVNEEEYLQSFKSELMGVVYAWSKGSSFLEIAKMTNVYEGSLIRLFRRLEELLRQMGQAAKVMGSEDLEKKFEEALGKIRRDIVSAQSLYL